ncbi:MAG: methyltransferase domain-containing protein [Gammaproteobacteria bacterium]|nr:methyltransferase domain-containing protein [Gammaproteobacteria bacterium]
MGQAREQLRDWYQEPLGALVREEELTLMGQLLPGLFGYHLLQLGDVAGEGWLVSSRISHRMVMVDTVPPGHSQAPQPEYLCGNAAQLPLASSSLDVVVLPHLLEFELAPHQVLREVERALIPEGHLVIFCFNPWSLFGLRRLLQGWRDEAPWSGHFYTPLRLKDWLSLLGFDTVLLRHYFYRPPLQHQATLSRLRRMEMLGPRFWPRLGGAYMLVAKKRVATLTPIKPRWRSTRGSITIGLTEPSARRDKHE